MQTTTLQLEAIESVVKALQFLAGRCDGAMRRDDVGFNGTDSRFGHSLADQSLTRELSDKQLLAARKVLVKYSKTQLAPAGIELPSAEELERDLEARRRAKAAVEPEAPRAAGYIRESRMFRGYFEVDFPYDGAKVARVKEFPGRQFKNLGSKKFWIVPKEHEDALVEAFPEFELDEALAARREAARLAAEALRKAREAQVARLLEAAGDLAAPLPNGWTLFQHQQEAVRRLLSDNILDGYHGGLLQHDMGLGKTLTSLIAARAWVRAEGAFIIVLSPAGVQSDWLKTARALGMKIEWYSWAKVPALPKHGRYVLIADEAHYAQNFGAQRTKRFLALAHSERCLFVVMATGTAMRNADPRNLLPLLDAGRHPLAENKAEYRRRFRITGSEVTDRRRLLELHEEIARFVDHKKKSECLDLPSKFRILRPVEISAEASDRYDRLFDELRGKYYAMLEEKRAEAETIRNELAALAEVYEAGEIDPDSYAEQSAALSKELNRLYMAEMAEKLVLLNHLRHAGSVAKVEPAVEMVEDLVAEGEQVVVFFEFQDAATDLVMRLRSKGIPTGFIHGGVDSKKARPAMIEQFQRGDLKVIVSTRAGGIGITLTAAQTVVLVDRFWTPGDVQQAEDRIDRIGQTGGQRGFLLSYWLQAFEVDEKIDDVLKRKVERIGLVLEGKADSLDLAAAGQDETPQEIAGRVLAELFGRAA